MDNNRLNYFVVVAETGSIRRASELLRISPAALSKSIKILEGELATQLFVPAGRGILLTDAGRELLTRAQPILKSLEELSMVFRNQELKGSAKDLRIGSFEVFTTYFLRGWSALLEANHQLTLRELVPGEMERALLANEVDFAITYIPIPTAGVEHQKVTSITMGIYGSKDFAKSHGKESYEEWPFAIPIQPITGAPNKVQGLDGWPDDRMPRKCPFRMAMMESALEFCRQGRAVAYLPNFVVKIHNETVDARFRLEPLPLPKGLGSGKQDVYLARRKSTAEDAIYKKLGRILRETCS